MSVGQEHREMQRGRPKKKPGYNREDSIQELLQTAVTLFGEPYDDRDERSPDAPSLSSVAKAMETTPMRVRKLLITAEFYSTESSRKVRALQEAGYSIEQIMEATGLKAAAVYGNLPLIRGAYLLNDPTLYADQGRLFLKRKKACETYADHIGAPDEEKYLWFALEAFQNYPFKLNGERFKYQIVDERLCFEKEDQLTREEVLAAYRGIREGSCPDQLKTEKLYPVFLRIGVSC